MKKTNVFVDSSVLISAILSSTGGSFYILQEYKEQCKFLINVYILDEILGVIQKKFPKRHLERSLFLLISTIPIYIVSDPPKQDISKFQKILPLKDAPIFASAIRHSSCLLTLDNDFLQEAVVVYAHKHKLNILKPETFIHTIKKD